MDSDVTENNRQNELKQGIKIMVNDVTVIKEKGSQQIMEDSKFKKSGFNASISGLDAFSDDNHSGMKNGDLMFGDDSGIGGSLFNGQDDGKWDMGEMSGLDKMGGLEGFKSGVSSNDGNNSKISDLDLGIHLGNMENIKKFDS